MRKKRRRIALMVALLVISAGVFIYGGQNTLDGTATFAEPYYGVPKVHIALEGLDQTGKLIYCGIDIGVFWDPDADGNFTIMQDDRKVKRLITTHTNITINLGPSADFQKGVLYKLGMRTLYVPTGAKQEPIVIADQTNGKDGWVEVPGSLFKPTYFINREPFIKHTQRWDENRLAYNKGKTSFEKEEDIRPYGVFWSGEKFEVYIEASEIVPEIKVRIDGALSMSGKPYEISITNYKAHPTISGAAIYTGTIWDKDMINRWGNYVAKELGFTMQIVSGAAILEEKKTAVAVDNKDLFYRQYRNY